MGLLGGALKAGLAKKAFSEAKKPQNQAKLKGLLSKVTNRGGSGGSRKTVRRSR